jgi:nickel-dependent lactate racemase
MKIPLAFGKTGITLTVPDRNLLKVLTIQGADAIPDPQADLRQALLTPIASPPLAEIARGKRSAVVVISDITRPVPNTLILPPVLETIERAGIPRERVTILVATGLHRPSTPDELIQMVGVEILRRYRIQDHHARVLEEQRHLGTTNSGTPVYIDRLYCDAELKVTTGFIEPHLMAGFSGGRKLIAPGCAGELTIKALHSPRFLEKSECREGSIDRNPLHRELLEIASMAGHDFIVNVALDEKHRVTGTFAGDPLRAHEEGVQFVRRAVRATIPRPADIVVTTSAGYPLDLTYYQAVKGMTAALPVVREGGMLVLAAECAEGLGSPEFTTMATKFATPQEFVDEIMTNPVVIDQWQLEECAKAARKAEVVLVSPRIAREHGSALFVRTSASVDEALEQGLAKYGPDATVAVIPKGPYTLVEVEASNDPS